MTLWQEGDKLTPANLNSKGPTPGNVLSSQSQVGVNSTSVLSFGVPASSLSVDGQSLRVLGYISGLGTTNLKLSFGNTALVSSFPINLDRVRLDALVHRSSVTQQTAHATLISSNNSYNLLRTAPGETLTSVVTITFQTTSAVTCNVDHFEVAVVPSP